MGTTYITKYSVMLQLWRKNGEVCIHRGSMALRVIKSLRNWKIKTTNPHSLVTWINFTQNTEHESPYAVGSSQDLSKSPSNHILWWSQHARSLPTAKAFRNQLGKNQGGAYYVPINWLILISKSILQLHNMTIRVPLCTWRKYEEVKNYSFL